MGICGGRRCSCNPDIFRLAVLAVTVYLSQGLFGIFPQLQKGWWIVLPAFGWTYVAIIFTGIVYTDSQEWQWLCQCLGWRARSRGSQGANDDPERTSSDLEEPLLAQDQEERLEEVIPQTTTSDVCLSNPTTSTTRKHFLDNLRIFLVGVVVTGHAVSSAVEYLWYPRGSTDNDDSINIQTLGPGIRAALDVVNCWIPVVMPCFFFIGGYVTPKSWKRCKHDARKFYQSKRRRLWWPALATSLVLVPLQSWWDRHFWSKLPYHYLPNPLHTWFLITLMVFQWMYCVTNNTTTLAANTSNDRTNDQSTSTDSQAPSFVQETPIQSASEDTATDNTCTTPLPSLRKRLCFGLLVAGALKLLLGEPFVPVNALILGDWPRHLLLFVAGIQAYHCGWLEPQVLHPQLRIVQWCAAIELVILTTLSTCLMWMGDTYSWQYYLIAPLVDIIGGAASLDYTVVLIHWFQTYASQPWPSFWKQSSYTVYLIHNLVLEIVATTTALVLREGMSREDNNDTDDGDNEPLLPTVHQRWFGSVVIVVGTHVLSWTLAYAISLLPWRVLKNLQ